MMIPEGLDKSIATVFTVATGGAALWAHRWEMSKIKRQAALEKHQAEEDAKKKYAEGQLKEYAAARDFGHIKRDLDQLKENTLHLTKDSDARLDQLERHFERFSGAIEVLTELLKERSKS